MKTIQSYLSNDLYYFCIQEKYQLFLDMKISKKNFNINQIRKLIYSCNLQERFPFKLDLNKEFEYTQLGILVLSNDANKISNFNPLIDTFSVLFGIYLSSLNTITQSKS